MTRDDHLRPRPVADNWRDQAACAGVPITVFFPDGVDLPHGRNAPSIDGYAHARTICNRCPVTDDCFSDAAAANDLHGFRAGRTPTELFQAIHGDGRGVPRMCEWCGATFVLGKFQNNRTRFCSVGCGRANDRDRWRERRRDRGGRAGAA